MSNYTSPLPRHGPSHLRTVHYPSPTNSSNPTPRNSHPSSYQASRHSYDPSHYSTDPTRYSHETSKRSSNPSQHSQQYQQPTPRESASSHTSHTSSRHSYQHPQHPQVPHHSPQYPHSPHYPPSHGSGRPSSQTLPHPLSNSPYAPKEDLSQPRLWAAPPSLPPNMQLPVSTRCSHKFKLLNSESDDLLWDCDMCGSGPHWFIFECRCVEKTQDSNGVIGIRRCALKACRNCAYEA
ncbi:hypothetical protein BJ508DRAFT_328926 [Ascobolus immersus RN42]|uniref:Uncharacterized protein n=1 Tax=Ascobolus immersus RN42 TaxID=1160509 RepID=A0A3N4HY22_ASCIM|nr:hypothetical protein BJ508DRAFT_328926 [Ascobolus immersus RN42]